MKLPLYFTIPILVAANGFTLILTQKNGEKIEIATEEIADMRFAEIAVPGNNIPTPQLTVQNQNYADFIVQWGWISNATSYEWSLDGGTPVSTTANQFRVTDLKEGTHQVKVRALTTDPDYDNSDYAEADLVATLRLQTTLENIGMNSVSAKIQSNSDKDYMVAIVPETVGRNESERIAYINANPTECQRKTVAAAAVSTVEFTGLEAGTQYCVVGFREDLSYSFATFFSTTMDLKPGSKGSIFPNGVTENGGFIDVDKVGDPSKFGLDDSGDQAGKGGGDTEMCWACTAAGLSQWWLDEYKRVTGEDYVLKAELPSHGVYTTDIMEALVLTYPNTAGDALMTIEWFFSGVERNAVLNGLSTYNESYPNWKGGFLGMTRNEMLQYINVSEEASDGYDQGEWPYVFHRLYSLKGLDMEQAKKKFSRILIETLREGPVGVIIPSHSVAFWGCDYEVDSDGDPIVTALYVGENGTTTGNIKNGLNKGTVNYKSANEIWFTLASMHDGGSVNTTRINSFFGIKGYKAK